MWWYSSTSNTAVQDVQRHSWKKDLEHCIPNPNVKVTLVQFLERHRCWHLLPNAFWQVSGSAGGQKRLDIGNVDEFRKQLAAQSLSSEIVRYFRNLVFSACCSFAMLRMNPADIWDLPGFAWTYEMIVGLKYAEMHSQTFSAIDGGACQCVMCAIEHARAAWGDQLRLWIIKAKQEWEEKHQQKGHKGETNDQERGPLFCSLFEIHWQLRRGHCSTAVHARLVSRYYIASIGETLGPNREYLAEASIGDPAAFWISTSDFFFVMLCSPLQFV